MDGAAVSGKFIVDSGFTGTLLLSKPFLNRHPQFLKGGNRFDVPAVEAVGGKMEMKAGPIEFLRIGGFTLKHPIVAFTLNGAGVLDTPEIDGVIGTDVLQRFRVAYDYFRDRIYLSPGIAGDDLEVANSN